MNTKKCKECNTTKPTTEFYKNRNNYVSYCKPCSIRKSNDRYHKAKNSTKFFMSNLWNITV